MIFKERKLLIFMIICLLMIFIPSFFLIQAKTNDPEPNADIKKNITTLIEDSHLLGTLVLVKNGEIHYTEGFGFANKEKNIQNGENIVYPIASLQKTMTAVIIAQLVREKKLSYDMTIESFYPNLEYASEITINDLLNHTSGLVMPEVPPKKVLNTEEDQLKNAIETSVYEDNHDYAYSNGNYSLLAGIISQIEKTSYEDSLKKRILKPLNMNNTYLWNHIPKDKVTPEEYFYSEETKTDYNTNNPVYSEKLMSSLLGAGNVYTTPTDITIFEMSLNNETILTKEEYTELFSIDDHYVVSRFGNISSDGVLGSFSSYLHGDLTDENFVIFLANQSAKSFPDDLLDQVYQQLLLF